VGTFYNWYNGKVKNIFDYFLSSTLDIRESVSLLISYLGINKINYDFIIITINVDLHTIIENKTSDINRK
jgi:hypothetical protein